MSDDTTPHKVCTKCQRLLPETSEFFQPGKGYKNGLRSQCRECVHQHRAEREGWTKTRRQMPKARDGFKWCPGCDQELPATLELFSPDKRGALGLKSYCKACAVKLSIDYRHANPEKHAASKKKWRGKNPDKVKKHKSESQKRNRPSANKRSKKWNDTHPEQRRAATMRRIARKHDAPGTYGADDIKRMFDEQEGQCAYCGIRIFLDIPFDVHVDHIIPLSKGGTNYPDNLCLACQSCNQSKNKHLYEDWIKIRGW